MADTAISPDAAAPPPAADKPAAAASAEAAPTPAADAPPAAADKPAAPAEAAPAAAAAAGGDADTGPTLAFTVTWGKEKASLKRRAASTVAELKEEMQRLFGVKPEKQKLMVKGLVKDDAATLEKVGIKDGAKVLLIGSRDEDVAAAAKAPEAAAGPSAWDAPAAAAEEPLHQQTQHAKVLAKGRPEDGIPGISGRQVPLADGQNAIPGLLNSQGSKVRLTFRPDISQLWVGSATHTQKLPYSSIQRIEAHPIPDADGYSMVALQLGAGKLWLYYFPSQHVAALKLRVLGLAALV